MAYRGTPLFLLFVGLKRAFYGQAQFKETLKLLAIFGSGIGIQLGYAITQAADTDKQPFGYGLVTHAL